MARTFHQDDPPRVYLPGVLPRTLDDEDAVSHCACGERVRWGRTIGGEEATFDWEPPHSNHRLTCEGEGVVMGSEGQPCRTCGAVFIVSRSEAAFFDKKGLVQPKRCPECRKFNKRDIAARRAEHANRREL